MAQDQQQDDAQSTSFAGSSRGSDMDIRTIPTNSGPAISTGAAKTEVPTPGSQEKDPIYITRSGTTTGDLDEAKNS